jgi:hypothetical protein
MNMKLSFSVATEFVKTKTLNLNFATFLEFSYSCLSFKFSIFVVIALIHNRTDLKLFRMQHWNFNEFAKK